MRLLVDALRTSTKDATRCLRRSNAAHIICERSRKSALADGRRGLILKHVVKKNLNRRLNELKIYWALRFDVRGIVRQKLSSANAAAATSVSPAMPATTVNTR
jgi:hypothetical protein